MLLLMQLSKRVRDLQDRVLQYLLICPGGLLLDPDKSGSHLHALSRPTPGLHRRSRRRSARPSPPPYSPCPTAGVRRCQLPSPAARHHPSSSALHHRRRSIAAGAGRTRVRHTTRICPGRTVESTRHSTGDCRRRHRPPAKRFWRPLFCAGVCHARLVLRYRAIRP
jgi:hypothetical protein